MRVYHFFQELHLDRNFIDCPARRVLLDGGITVPSLAAALNPLAFFLELFLEPAGGVSMFIHKSFIDLQEVLLIASNQLCDLRCDFMVDLLLVGGISGGVVEAAVLGHELVSGDLPGTLEFLGY